MRRLRNYNSPVLLTALTPNANQIITKFGNGIKKRDFGNGTEVLEIGEHKDYIQGLVVTADEPKAISASKDKTLIIWVLECGTELYTLTGHTAYVNCVAISLQTHEIVSGSNGGGKKIWDLPTQASLSRNLIETYLTFFYIGIEKVDSDEKELRMFLWKYHEINEKIKMLEVGIPDSQNIPDLIKSRKLAKERLTSNSAFIKLLPGKQKELLQKDQSKTKSNIEICKSAGISEKYFRMNFKYLSNFTHSSPLSISQMDDSRVFNPDALFLFQNVLNISAGFMAAALSDYRKLNSKVKFKFDLNTLRTIRIWREVHKWDLETALRAML